MPKLKKFWKRWILIILIVVLFLMVMGLNSSLAEYFRLTEQRRQMTERIDNLEATQYALETQIAFADSDKAVEEWARTYQRYVQPGDQVIIPLSPQDVTPEVHYLATPTPSQEENWQIWWELFFGN
jgi:cell division protein FtsB